MKKLFSLLTMLLLAIVVFAAEKVQTVFTLDHQMSENCEKKIKSNLRYEKGVKDIDVSLKENTITITYEQGKTNEAKLLQAFNKIGFNAFVVNADGECQHKCGACKKESNGCCKQDSAEKAVKKQTDKPGNCCSK